MLKGIALALLLANLAFLAWTQGWLGGLAPQPPAMAGRDPERLMQQVRPDSVQVLRPRDVSAALARQASEAAAQTSKAPPGAQTPTPSP